MSESCEPITSQQSTLWGPIRNSARSSLSLSFTPLAEIISQSQSWLSLPRPNKSSTYEFVNQTVSHRRTSELIKTV